MSDTPTPQSSGAAEPELRDARRSFFSRVSVVWVVPVAALLISLGIVWQTYADQGPLIEISFPTAEGVRAEETQVRYRDVVVGLVEDVRFDDDLSTVLVDVRLDKGVGPFVDADAEFWVVKPEVSAQGISGLDTVLGGVYIEGSWDGEPGESATRFEGAAAAPLIRYGQEGVAFRFRSQNVEGLSEGTKIYYRGIEVGQIANLRLDTDGTSVVADAFIRSPEAQLVTTASRFWDTSGFTFSFGASGAQLDVASIASLVQGGISFDTPVSGGEPVTEDTVFRLYGDEETARSSVFAGSGEGEPVSLTVVFSESVPGLETGADVEFGGVNVGRVSSLTGLLDEERFGDSGIRLLVTLEIQPSKLGLDGETDADQIYDFFDFAVNSGLRAQLQTASLLGGLQVSLVQVDDVETATLDMDAEPYPRIPSIDADLSDFADTAQGVFNRVNNLPIEELLENAIQLMASANRLVASDGVQESPDEVLGILSAVRGLVSSDGVQDIPDQANALMATLNDTAVTLQGVVGELREAGAVAQLVAALDAAEDAANAVFVAVDEVPATLAEIDTAVQSLDELIGSVNELPLMSVVQETEGSIAALRELLARPATQGLTTDVSNLLTTVEGLVSEIRAAGLVETAEATLTDLRGVVTNLSEELNPLMAEARQAVANTQETIDAVPGLLDSIDTFVGDLNTVVNGIGDLPLNQAVTDVSALLASLDQLISRSETQAVPGEVNETLAAARQLMDEVVEGGVLDQATQTLASTETAINDLTLQLRSVLTEAQRAATSLANAADDAPQITERANAIAEDIETLTAQASELPLDELTERVTGLVTSADALVSSPDTQRVPGALSDALTEVQRLLIQIQEGGLVESANQTLASASQAADAIRRASDQLPALLTTTGSLLTQTQTIIGGYEVNGPVGSQVRTTLREIEQAANSIQNLARQIERAPNSLLFGR